MKNIDFMNMRKACAAGSILLIILSLGYMAVFGVKRSVDFAGGTKMTVLFSDDNVSVASLREKVATVDEKATIVHIDHEPGSMFMIKIKNPEVEEGKEAEASLARFLALEKAFSEITGETPDQIQLIRTKSAQELAARLIQENPYGLTGTDAEVEATYNQVAQNVASAAGSARDVYGLAQAADSQNAEKLAQGLRLAFPAVNRSTTDLLGALLRRNNPLNRQRGADYTDIAEQITAYRESQNDFIQDFETMMGKVTVGEGEEPAALTAFFQDNFTKGSFRITSNETFSPSIAVELLRKAWTAVLLSLFGILCYVGLRFNLGYGMASIVALAHDIVIALGIFAIAGRELSNPVVAAFLTIIGYSLNDTIVVFDRIRDNLRHGVRMELPDLMNTSINQTLSRTLVTSLTTLFVVGVVYFGANNETLQDFAFPLLVGILVGTYSSIFVASPFLLFWHNKVKPITG